MFVQRNSENHNYDPATANA
jgi:hypothetical protein